ncbi:MAG: hypothetical protein F6K40_11705 [Okeania sp. SIO3I5]|uniref:hypothetical protein n=1 Tax=Okeania sp. SIO3I5 TaxID=2607805 RepID=UPI0013BBE08F|nr:hypothetical protein [Okeania sp. SIO3I5]NEQ36907.1 hypothetical protein [Okeania sp. SIO3I5]
MVTREKVERGGWEGWEGWEGWGVCEVWGVWEVWEAWEDLAIALRWNIFVHPREQDARTGNN